MTEYPEAHPVSRIRSSNEHAISGGRYQTAVEELIGMWEAFNAQKIEGQLIAKSEPVPCERCAQIQELFPIAEPAPLDATTVKRWIDENFK